MDFRELEELRRQLEEINARQVASLEYYYDPDSSGFFHLYERGDPGDFSKSSTATCVLSLWATHRLTDPPWRDGLPKLYRAMLEVEWKSAGLETNNPFTTAFILEAVTALGETDAGCSEESLGSRLEEAKTILSEAIRPGKVKLDPYPPSAYLTQLVARALRRPEALDQSTQGEVVVWAWSEIDRQIALAATRSKSCDLYQLAYAVILVGSLADPAEATPDQGVLLQAALDTIFAGQLEDGSWPRSLPLFHYPKVGSAYCYEYEMLAQLLSVRSLQDRLLRYLPQLKRAVGALRETQFKIGQAGAGWSSGHHPQLKGPESWTTASVFHFCHVLDRLVAEAIRRTLFEELEAPYLPAPATTKQPGEFAPDSKFLDCDLRMLDRRCLSLRSTLYDCFVEPIARNAPLVESGQSLPEDTWTSAIFFGPPGTSKTDLSFHIASFLGWRRLVIDPSHFVRHGLDQVQAEADKIFSMLAASEQLVVLLDEFDEMVRDRNIANDVLSRFLTTSMLPKLATINKRRRIVFIVATNYIDHFDFAIGRPGRFDVILQVMPPSFDAKAGRWPELRDLVGDLPEGEGSKLKEEIGDFTFDECRVLVQQMKGSGSTAEKLTLVHQAHASCTLSQPAFRPLLRSTGTGRRSRGRMAGTWKATCERQRSMIRPPHLCGASPSTGTG